MMEEAADWVASREVADLHGALGHVIDQLIPRSERVYGRDPLPKVYRLKEGWGEYHFFIEDWDEDGQSENVSIKKLQMVKDSGSLSVSLYSSSQEEPEIVLGVSDDRGHMRFSSHHPKDQYVVLAKTESIIDMMESWLKGDHGYMPYAMQEYQKMRVERVLSF